VTEQDYKRHLRKRQSEIYLVDVPKDEYVVTIDGQYRCAICSHLPPFSNGRDLAAHIRGKKHMTRKMIKLEKKNLPAVPDSSMAMPSLLYRTKAITERVLSSNHDEPVANPRPVPKPFVFVPPELSATGEPLWRQKMLQEKEEEEMIAKGFRKGEDGQWQRDEIVEFDSDEEPQCVDGKIIAGSGALPSGGKAGDGNSSSTTNEMPSAV
ncbi:hypothetical protein WA538_002030, partial [Blastocystis sp. DL]